MGEIEDADGAGEVGNMKCGDLMKIYLKIEVKDGVEYVKDIKFQTLGCAAAVSSSSMMTELAKGKTLKEVKAITKDDINKALGILPKHKYHCSILSANAIKKAIEDYESKKRKK